MLFGCATSETQPPAPRLRSFRPAVAVDAAGAGIMPGKIDKATAKRMEALRSRIESAPFAPTPGYDLAGDLRKRNATTTKQAVLNGWTAIGPGNAGGRIRAFAVDPSNPNKLWVGGPGGGIWTSSNGGASWQAVDDALPSMVISCIVIDPSNTNVMYACTGEDFNSLSKLRGLGILKSTDGGNTWSLLPGTNPAIHGPGFYYVSRIALQPGNSNVLLAAGYDGVYRSADAGATWTRVYVPSGGGVSQLMGSVAFDPNNPGSAIAGGFGGEAAFSRDGGLTWTERRIVSSATFYLRVEPAYAPTVPGLVYASVDDLGLAPAGSQSGRFYRSTDGGDTWQQLSQPGHLLNQGGYANSIWVDPTNSRVIVIGGFNLMRSVDGGTTFLDISGSLLGPGNGVHPDQHVIVAQPGYDGSNPSRRIVYAGNDGGLYRSSDILAADSSGTTWTRLNNGLEVTQFYSGASAGGRVSGGTQDVGTLTFFPEFGRWRTFSGGTYMQGAVVASFTQDPDRTMTGDSGGIAADPTDSMRIYYASLYLQIGRSTDGGATFNQICAGLADASCGFASQSANFSSPVVLDPRDPSRLYAGAASLWVSDNARDATPSWRNIKARPVPYNGFDNINAIGIAPGDSNIVWVGYDDGTLAVTQNALAAAPAWTSITAPLPRNRPVTSILVSASDSHTVYVTWGNDGFYDTGYASGNLQRTSDLGATWTNISASLPNVPMYSIVQRPGNPSELYVGTAAGIHSSTDAGATWSASNVGPANTMFTQLFWLDGSTLGAATYGRSMFKKNLAAAAAPANYQGLWWKSPAGSESGWGVNVTQQGDILFATWFTYDADGSGMWLVMSDGAKTADGTYSGTLYRTTGPWLGAVPWNPSQVVPTPVGNATFTFSDANDGMFAYTVNGVTQSKAIARQIFSSPVPTCVAGAAPGASPNYQGLWWRSPAGSESGWGVNITHQGDILFATWFTYDASGKGEWLVMSDGAKTGPGTYSGTLYRTTGPPFDANPWNPSAVVPTPAGSGTFTFSDAGNGTFSYTVDGVSQSKPITRQIYASPVTICN